MKGLLGRGCCRPLFRAVLQRGTIFRGGYSPNATLQQGSSLAGLLPSSLRVKRADKKRYPRAFGPRLCCVVVLMLVLGASCGGDDRTAGTARFADKSAQEWARLLSSSDGVERQELRQRLVDGGVAALGVLVELTDSDDPAVRTEVTRVCKALGASVVPALLRRLGTSASPGLVRVLAGVGAQARPALPALDSLLGAEDAAIRCSAAYAIGSIASDGDQESARALLRALTTDSDLRVRRWAAIALGRMAAGGDEVVDALVGAMHQGDAALHLNASEALGKLGPRSAGAVPALMEDLSDSRSAVRQTAAASLGAIGAAAEPAIPLLNEAARRFPSNVRPIEEEAVKRIREAIEQRERAKRAEAHQ